MTDQPSAEVLGAAIEAARRALRDIDEDDLPASLRRIAASSARRLPKPLAMALVQRLDEYEWLREKAMAAWPDIDDARQDEAASVAFLKRDPGWELVVEAAGAIARSKALHQETEQLRRQVEELRGRLAVEADRARRARAEAAEAEALATGRARRLTEAVNAARAEERRRGAEVRSSRARLAEQVAALESQLAEADLRLDIAKRDLLRARRSSDVQARPETSAEVWTPRDPSELARLLDDVAKAALPAIEFEETELEEATPWELPSGVRPDSGEAIRWLLERDEPYTVIIDGYNVSNQPADPLTRDQVDLMAARWRRLAAAPVRMIVVYDSQVAQAQTTGSGPGGIEVRFTAEGRSADTEIVELSAAVSGPVVVVTSDRQVREEAEATVTLWSEALLDWARRP